MAKPGIGLRSPDSLALPGMPGFLPRDWNGWAKAQWGLEILFVATSGCLHPPYPAVGMGASQQGVRGGHGSENLWGSGKLGTVLPHRVHRIPAALAACPPSPRHCAPVADH